MTRCLVVSLLALSASALLGPGAAWAGAFDGKWVADLPAQTNCNTTSTMTLLVSGDDIAGEVQNPGNRHHFKGKLQPDGSAAFSVEGKWFGTMNFRGDHFEATWNNGSCDRHASGDRALTDQQREEAAADRKRHQEAYAALVQRADAGDRTVDYTTLRMESVYAKTWEFYDGKARGLLYQANAAVKGKDCPAAMALLDQVIKLDFVIDSAHSLRADCLRAAGRNDEARTEDAIAKGLIHSLMDSGNGDTEKSAYVVTTQREEMDVLANRRIQLKTRDTQVRGSDGRYFDLAHGISITGGYSLDIRARNVYFDVSAFMTGRASRRAVVETAVAAVTEAQ